MCKKLSVVDSAPTRLKGTPNSLALKSSTTQRNQPSVTPRAFVSEWLAPIPRQKANFRQHRAREDKIKTLVLCSTFQAVCFDSSPHSKKNFGEFVAESVLVCFRALYFVQWRVCCCHGAKFVASCQIRVRVHGLFVSTLQLSNYYEQL